MAAAIGCLALFFPRLAIILVVIFSDYIGDACQTVIWPLLGFIFLPLTTLAYAWAWHSGGGSIQGVGLIAIVVAVILDLGLHGGAGKSATRRRTA